MESPFHNLSQNDIKETSEVSILAVKIAGEEKCILARIECKQGTMHISATDGLYAYQTSCKWSESLLQSLTFSSD